MLSYRPYRRYAAKWQLLLDATATRSVEEALIEAAKIGLTEALLVQTFGLSRWAVRGACAAYQIKLPDGRL